MSEDKPKMKLPPLKKKHRILGELPPDSLAAALHHRELVQEAGQQEIGTCDPKGRALCAD